MAYFVGVSSDPFDVQSNHKIHNRCGGEPFPYEVCRHHAKTCIDVSV